MYRYSEKEYMASCFTELTPDAGMIYFSGQAGMTYTSSKYFLEQPLMMISTWDGDEFHFLSFYESFKKVRLQLDDYKKTQKQFQEKIIDELSRYEMDVIKLENGIGYFKGSIPQSLSKMFVQHCGLFIVCPSYDAMKEYLES
jgi:hypothetical protein